MTCTNKSCQELVEDAKAMATENDRITREAKHALQMHLSGNYMGARMALERILEDK